MLYAYVLENKEEQLRDNSPIFKLITELELEDDQTYFDMDYEKRTGLQELKELLEHGDRIMVRSVCDLAESLDALMELLKFFSEKEISLCSCNEPYLSGTDYLTILQGAVSIQDYFSQRKREIGYQRARTENRVGRPATQKSKDFEKTIDLYKKGIISMEQAVALTGVSSSTIYRYAKEIGNEKEQIVG